MTPFGGGERWEAGALQSGSRLLLAQAIGPALIAEESQTGLASEVQDWPAYLEQAEYHLMLPLVIGQAAMLTPYLPQDALAALRQKSLARAAKNLRLARTLANLHRDWFSASGVRYALVKGIGIASRYYGGVAERSCRDLDLLVERDRFEATVTYLCAAGFTLCGKFRLPADPGRHASHIAALCDLNREVSFLSPDGELIDVHHNLDLTGADMPTDQLLARAESHSILGEEIPVLSTTDLFVYVCYHHSRHSWSRLHWLADLSRIASAPDFDRESVVLAARRAGLAKLVEACLEMPLLLANAVRRDSLMPKSLAGRMASECLEFLDTGTLPPILVQFQRTNDRLFRWKYWFVITAWEWRRRTGVRRKMRAIGRSVTPSWQMYQDLPLPRPLRWLYVPLRVGAHLIRFTPVPRLRKAKRKPAHTGSSPPPRADHGLPRQQPEGEARRSS